MDKILLIGATGLVGSQIINQAGSRPLSVLVRTPMAASARTISVAVVDPDDWPDHIAAARPDRLICCIGTTMKKAGSAAQFAAIDRDLVLACGAAAKQAGASQMIVMTSVGASARASNIYLKTKGEVERDLTAMGFDRLDIIRPGLLRGDRAELRPGEAIARTLAPLFDAMLIGGLRKYRSISDVQVARAILALATQTGGGAHVHENAALVELAG